MTQFEITPAHETIADIEKLATKENFEYKKDYYCFVCGGLKSALENQVNETIYWHNEWLKVFNITLKYSEEIENSEKFKLAA
jgi:hypothetical protein